MQQIREDRVSKPCSICRSLAAALIAFAVVSGCSPQRVVYQSDYRYLWPGEVRNSMGQLANHIRQLDDLLVSESLGPEQRETVIEHLRSMESIADDLGAGPEQTNHAFIDAHIDEFRTDVKNARREVEQEPPRYYLAGRLAGSCTGCHVLR